MSDPTPLLGDQPAEPQPDGDRRATDRYPSNALIVCRPLALPKKESLAALVQDVGRRGISLVLRYPLNPGTVLVIDLSDLTGGAPEPILARVVHVQPRAGGRWLVGCALQKELTEQQLAACLAEPEQQPWVSVAAAEDDYD
jgi:hypothetical protein